MDNLSKVQLKVWEVGDTYTVICDGEHLRGVITKINESPEGDRSYTVNWSNGETTNECKPDPATPKY